MSSFLYAPQVQQLIATPIAKYKYEKTPNN